MAYNSGIPKPFDKLRLSQSDILNNFGAIESFVNENHVEFDDPNQGKHNMATLQSNALALPSTLDNEILAFYYLNNLVVKRQEDGDFVNITNGVANFTSEGTNGYAYIGNSLIKWGTIAVPNGEQNYKTHLFPLLTNNLGGEDRFIPEFKTAPIVFLEQVERIVGINRVYLTGFATNLSFETVGVAISDGLIFPFLAIGT